VLEGDDEVMTERWQRFWSLSGYERGIVLETMAALPASWLGLRLVGYRRWHTILARLVPSTDQTAHPASAIQQQTAQLIARMSTKAARNLFFGTNCLEQSLVLWWVLRRRGIAAELRIGARKRCERFEAHAWIEVDSVVLNEVSEEHYHFVPFDGPISAQEARTD
jgi:hypothetical protein